MSERMARWIGGATLLGLAPLAIAYLVRCYYLGQPPPLRDVLGTGDGMLVVVSWSVGALVDLPDARLPSGWRSALNSFGFAMLMFGSVAYGCLTADSVTGRVQTPVQAQFVTVGTMGMLVLAAAMGIVATARRRRPKGDLA